MTNRLTLTAPPVIYLQVSDDKTDLDEEFPAGFDWIGGVTWCQDSATNAEVKYVRADKVERLRALLKAVIECDDLSGWCGPEASLLYDSIGTELDNA